MSDIDEELKKVHAELERRTAEQLERATGEEQVADNEPRTLTDHALATGIGVSETLDALPPEVETAALTVAGGAAAYKSPAMLRWLRANPWVLAGTAAIAAGQKLPNESSEDYQVRMRMVMERNEYDSLSYTMEREEQIREQVRKRRAVNGE